jgi:hypothetical protein
MESRVSFPKLSIFDPADFPRLMTDRIDMHVHVYEESVARRAIANIRHFREAAGIKGIEIAEEGTPAFLTRGMERLGINKSVIQAVVLRPEIMGKVNAWTHATVRDSGGKFQAFGGIHPLAPKENIADELKRFTQEYGFKGVKLHPTLQGFDPMGTEARRLYPLIEKAGLALLIHPDRRGQSFRHGSSGERIMREGHDKPHPFVLTADKLCDLIEAFPDLTIVAAHLGGSPSDRLETVVKASHNVWLDLAIMKIFFPEGPDYVASLIRRYGVERILFGSDFPFWPQEAAIAYLARLGLTEEERRQIERDNPARILQP